MKQLFFLAMALLFCEFVQAQNVGIGTNTPNNSAMLEISSTNKGLLLPRVADTSSVPSPVRGLLIYSTNNNKLWYHDGSRWQNANSSDDAIWYKQRDTIAYTTNKYVAINTDLNAGPIQEGLQASGSLVIQGKLLYSNSTPTAAQTYTMTNLPAQQSIPAADSVFRIYDPGGTGNYNNNMQGNIVLNSSTYQVGFKISSVAADFGLGTGDTLWIGPVGYPSCRTNYAYRFTSTSPNPGDMISSNAYYVSFRSNGDGSNGKGFNFIFTRLANKQESQKIEAAGPSLIFNGVSGSFSAGMNAVAADRYSTAFGLSSTAGGVASFATGYNSFAGGQYSIAGGYSNRTEGNSSVALGSANYAIGDNSLALGNSASAENNGSTAIGTSLTVSGAYATGIGAFVDVSGQYAVGLGNGTTASGLRSTAMGYSTVASGEIATAIGWNTEASGKASVAMGENTIARGYASTVVGMYNDPLIGSSQTAPSGFTPLFIVGDGTDAANRRNAMVIMRGGNVGIGINNPAFKLEVDKNIMVRADERPSVSIRHYDNVGGSMVIDEDNNMEIGTNVWNTTGKLLFTLNSNVKLTIDTDGDTRLDGNMTFNKSSNTTLSLQANAVEKGFVQLSGNDLRMGTYSSNSTGKVILRSGGSDKLIVDDDGDVKVTNNLLVRGNKGIMSNANGSAALKYYTKTVAFGASLPAFGTSGEGFITFPAGVFTTPPQVIVGDIVSTGGASGQLYRMQLVVYNVTTTGCNARLINTHNAAIDYSVTWNLILIGD